MKTLKLIFATLITTSLVFTSCKKEEKPPTNTAAAGDNAQAENAFAGIWKEISTVTDTSGALRANRGGCGTVTISPFDLVTWPKTVIIDYGTVNCAGSDGNNRRGIVAAIFSAPFHDSLAKITITLTNYFHNDYNIKGTQVVTNKGRNSLSHPVYNVDVTNASVTNPNTNKTASWATNQDREFYAGYNTHFNVYDDVYLIYGNANGISEDGQPYTIVINSPLKVNIGCQWVVKGDLTLTLLNYPAYPIDFDYGAGTCDNQATATLNNVTYNITMN